MRMHMYALRNEIGRGSGNTPQEVHTVYEGTEERFRQHVADGEHENVVWYVSLLFPSNAILSIKLIYLL